MIDDQIDRFLAISRPGLIAALGSAPIFRGYCERKMQIERELAGIATMMRLAYDMDAADAWRYAGEARECVGHGAAYDAACAGRPFLLPWRGPDKPAEQAPTLRRTGVLL